MEEGKNRHSTDLSRMRRQLDTQGARLKKDIETLNAALLARDRYKAIADQELKTRFEKLGTEIDYLSRVEWKLRQADWTDKLLSRLSANQRKLKQQIVQDSLWLVLFEHIFCSPFRILGVEGVKRDAQWNEICGKGLRSLLGYGGVIADTNRP
jgi:hypothetical protein